MGWLPVFNPTPLGRRSNTSRESAETKTCAIGFSRWGLKRRIHIKKRECCPRVDFSFGKRVNYMLQQYVASVPRLPNVRVLPNIPISSCRF